MRLDSDAVVEDVGHGPKLRGAFGAQGLGRGAGAAAAAADQGDLDRVVFGGVAAGGNGAQQGRAGQRGARGLEEIAAGSRGTDCLFGAAHARLLFIGGAGGNAAGIPRIIHLSCALRTALSRAGIGLLFPSILSTMLGKAASQMKSARLGGGRRAPLYCNPGRVVVGYCESAGERRPICPRFFPTPFSLHRQSRRSSHEPQPTHTPRFLEDRRRHGGGGHRGAVLFLRVPWPTPSEPRRQAHRGRHRRGRARLGHRPPGRRGWPTWSPAPTSTWATPARFAKESLASKCQVYQDYRKLLERKDMEAVTIGTPDHWHVKIAIDAMKAGKHVYCEKPLTLTLEEGELICEAVEEVWQDVPSRHAAAERVRRPLPQGRGHRPQRPAGQESPRGQFGGRGRLAQGKDKDKPIGPFQTARPPAELDWDMWLGQAPKVPFCPERIGWDFRWWYRVFRRPGDRLGRPPHRHRLLGAGRQGRAGRRGRSRRAASSSRSTAEKVLDFLLGKIPAKDMPPGLQRRPLVRRGPEALDRQHDQADQRPERIADRRREGEDPRQPRTV